MNKEQFIDKWDSVFDYFGRKKELQKKMEKEMSDDLDLLIKRQTDLIEHLQKRIRIAESKNETKMKYINADKLIERLDDQFYEEVSIEYIKSLIDELSEAREEQPTPLKVAIKGDCTYDYSKKIFQYFKSHTIKGQHDVDSFVEDVYYYIEKGNIVFLPFLPEGYTEISLKEDEKVVTDNSKVNTHLLNRVEELEKELIDLKLKLKEVLQKLIHL